jgi:hypothetical protein
MNKNTLVFFLILFTIISCNVFAQSGVALDAWKKSKTLQETTYTKSEVDEYLGGLAADLAQGNRIYYCSSGTEDIGGVTYGKLIQTLDPVGTTVTIGPIVGSTYAQYSPGRGRITPATGIGVTTIPAGNFNRVSFMSNADTSGRSITIRYALWRTDSAGTKIEQIATSTEYVIEALGASVIQRSDVIYAVSSDITTLATDRLMEEYWFKRSGTTTGADPSIVRYVGGNHAGFVSFALPSGVTMLTDASNAVLPDARTNLDVPSFAEANASYTLSLNFTTQSIATHSLLSNSHNSTVIASSAYVDGRITETDASYTLSLGFTTQSIATHSLLSTSHNCTTIASSAYVDTAVSTRAVFKRAEVTIGGTATSTITFTTDIDSNPVAIASLSKTIIVINGVMQSYSNFTKTNDTQLESTVGDIEENSKIILMQFD